MLYSVSEISKLIDLSKVSIYKRLKLNNKYSLTGSHQGRFKITDDIVETHKEFEHSDKALKAMNANNSIKDIKNLILKIKQK